MYEFMFILDTSKVGSDVPAAIAQLHAVLEKNGAEILASRVWNEQRLIYPIRNQKKGLYYLIYVRCDSKKIVEVEREYKLNEAILRYMPIHIEPKWQEQMLAVAKDEHALALQVARDDIDTDDYGGPRGHHGGDKD
jgi:small subunit ribosomal protein S6